MAEGSALERGILRSDLLRSALLAATLVVMLAGNALVALVTPQALPPVVRGHVAGLCALVAFAFAHEGTIVALVRRAIRTGRALPPIVRYVNAFVELSFPTLVILLLAGETDGLVLLHGPTPYIYFLLILLSTLHLDARVCVWAGVVAAIEY